MDLIHLHAALDTFHADTHRYPTTAEGLEALVTPPQGVDGWHGPYIEKVQPDKWGHPYRYTFPNPEKPATFDLHSVGGDGIDGTDDDVYEAAE